MDAPNRKPYIVIHILIITVFCLVYVGLFYKYNNQSSNFLIISQFLLIIVLIVMHFITSYLIIKKNKVVIAKQNELKDYNLKLIEKEELFRTIYEQSPLGITFGNLNENILDVNLMFEKIVGRSREELINKKWSEITHPDDINIDRELFYRNIKDNLSGYSLKKRYIRPDNSAVWVNMTIALISLESRPELSHICIIEDVSDQVQAEINLSDSERSKAMLLSSLPGMAYRCKFDHDWTMLYVSDGCFDLTGYSSDNLLYNKEISFNNIIEEQYRDRLWKKWVQILEQKGIFKEEYQIQTANGEKKWVYEQGQGVYDNNDNVMEIEGLIIDISFQKNREEEMRYLTYHDVMTGLYNRRYYDEIKTTLDREECYPLSIIIGDINGLKLINSALGHGVGDEIILIVSDILKSSIRPNDILARIGGDEFSIIMPNTSYEEANRVLSNISEQCEEPSSNKKKEYHLSFSLGLATKNDNSSSLSEIIKMAEDSMFRQKLLQNKSLHSSIISSMKNSLYEKSQETEEHALRLIEISKEFGRKLNLVNEQLIELELLSTLHDIGKIGITDNILNKPGRLSDDEWKEMKKHPEMGYRIAMSTPELKPIAEYILNHHEKWDGSGYPYGRKGEEIPLLARIIAIADAYDAMTSDRPYRQALSKEEALNEIKINAGTQFDPNLSNIFLNEIADNL